LKLSTNLKSIAKADMPIFLLLGLIADTAAMPLITSNPINILSADFFEYTFIDHLFFIGPIAIATIASSMLLIFLFFRKKIPKKYDLKLADTLYLGSVPISPNMLRLSLITLVAIDVGYIIASMSRIPVSLVICTGSIFLLSVYLASLNGEIIRGERKGLKGLTQTSTGTYFSSC
jgi:arsenical pump membrane protein